MRPATVLSFLAASMAVLSPVCAAPVPTQVDAAGVKRMCTYSVCRTAELPTTGADGSQTSLLALVEALISTLTTFKDNISPPINITSTVDLAGVGPFTEIDIVEPEVSA